MWTGRAPKIWKIKKATLPMEITLGVDGMFVGRFPALRGCMAEGRTYEEAVLNTAKAIVLIVQSGTAVGIPVGDMRPGEEGDDHGPDHPERTA